MEAQPQAEDVQAVSHQHDNGEVFEANNLEAARGMCPVLGKLSLKEAGLLLELEAMGKEHLADQQTAPTEKAVIEKVEKVHPKHNGIRKVAEPEVKEAVRETVHQPELLLRKIAEPTVKVGDSIASKPVEADLHAMLMQQAEAVRITNNAGHESEEVDEAPMVRTEATESLQPMSNGEEVHRRVEVKATETATRHEGQSTIEEQAPATSEYAINPSDESLSEQPLDAQAITEPEAMDVLPTTEDMKLPLANEATSDPVILESDKEAADVMPIIEGMEQGYPEYRDEEEGSAEIIKAAQLAEDQSTELIQAESFPIIEIAELPAPVAQIETTIVQLVETLENDKEETAKINSILGEIIALPAKLEVALDDETEVLEEKLEELFAALFEEADISYSPALIESFVKLTKSHYLEQLLEITAEAEEAADLPHEIGTREFLQKLQHGLSAMKQAVINFYELGKSIMRLYSFSYQTANLTLS